MNLYKILDRITTPLIELYGAREARNIALLVAEELSGISRSALLTDPHKTIEIKNLDSIIAQLAAGCPVQYVLGSTEFYNRCFTVGEGVLIPRSETEELVRWVIRQERKSRRLLDIGTGSGCIAATLALELPETEVFAADISEKALAIADENCNALGATVTLRKADALADLAEIFPEQFDALISNPPYVPKRDAESMHPNVRNHEPHEALFVPSDDPLLFYRAIARAGRTMLCGGGKIYFEIYENFAKQLIEMLDTEGYTGIELRRDIYDKARMICCRLK